MYTMFLINCIRSNLDLSSHEFDSNVLIRYVISALPYRHNELESVIDDLVYFPESTLVDMSSNLIENINGSKLQIMMKNKLKVSLRSKC